MSKLLTTSLIVALGAIFLTYLVNNAFQPVEWIADVGGIGSFATVFGTLYGIMSAFVVFEVWSQYNKTVELIEREAQGLERLFRLTDYFRDGHLAGSMKVAIKSYIDKVVSARFQNLADGSRNPETGQLFRAIGRVIKDIKFDDDHDAIVFEKVVSDYEDLSQTRTARIGQSLTRLPIVLKGLLHIFSLVAVLIFVIMPFTNQYYAFFAAGATAFIVSLVINIVDDLDNPFKGIWNITPAPYARALKHIEEDY